MFMCLSVCVCSSRENTSGVVLVGDPFRKKKVCLIANPLTYSLLQTDFSVSVFLLLFLSPPRRAAFVFVFIFFNERARAMMSLARGRTIYDRSEGSAENILTIHRRRRRAARRV